MKHAILLLLGYFLLPFNGKGQGIELLSYKESKVVSLGKYLQYYGDKSQYFGINQLLQLPPNAFQKSDKKAPNFGVRKTKIWLKIEIENDLNEEEGSVVMTDESEVCVSRTKKAELLAILGI